MDVLHTDPLGIPMPVVCALLDIGATYAMLWFLTGHDRARGLITVGTIITHANNLVHKTVDLAEWYDYENASTMHAHSTS